jgi:hypothetical protein
VNRVHLEEVDFTQSHLGLDVGQVCCQAEISSISENISNPELACCIEYCDSTSTIRPTNWAPARVPRETSLISSPKPHIVSHESCQSSHPTQQAQRQPETMWALPAAVFVQRAQLLLHLGILQRHKRSPAEGTPARSIEIFTSSRHFAAQFRLGFMLTLPR